MFVRLVSRVVVSALLVVGAVTLVSQPALASCAEIPDLETAFADAEVVFIGVVTELSNGNRTAEMQVEEVWKGPALPETVTVNGTPDLSSGATSVDRTYELGTYIVFPVNSTSPFEDNACTLTQRTSAALDVIAPNSVETPEAVTTGDVVTTTSADVGAIQDPGTAEGPEGQPVTGEPVLVSGGTNLTPIVVSALIIIAALGIAIVLWRRRPADRT
ncbi:MAG: hypothetical protein BMS9Abin17_1470 [Acidimicrobiia bacterium]|nr:MAG: hypothetical protein BMS9Abin17_1470 [Acidimicrobiia bacterium]